MKPEKEQAKELIEKFYEDKGFFNKLSWEQSKQFALICVDHIIEAIDWHPYESPNDEFKFWGAVKKHIEQE